MNEQMQKQFHKRQYPLVRYLGLLLAVALLFTGVTFARYATNTNIPASVGIAAFDVDYTIEGINSTTFGNSPYWQDFNSTEWYEQGAGSARTVRIQFKNNGGVAVQPTLRLSGPAIFWENIALQIAQGTTAESGSNEQIDASSAFAGESISTQYVFADLIKKRVEGSGTTLNGETHNYEYEGYRSWNGEEFDTINSDQFGQRESSDHGMIGETLKMSGGFQLSDDEPKFEKDTLTVTRTKKYYQNADGAITEVPEGERYPMTMTIKAEMPEVEYSVGFTRKEANSNHSLSALYLDCKKTMPYYTIEIKADRLVLKPGETKTVILFMTWTNVIHPEELTIDSPAAGETGEIEWGTTTGVDWDGLLDGTQTNYRGATVVGYHFNQTANVYDSEGDQKTDINGDPVTTTVRVNKRFNDDFTYDHVARLNENETDGAIAHAIESFYTLKGSDNSAMEPVQSPVLSTIQTSYYGVCSNDAESYISFQNLTDDPTEEGAAKITVASEIGYTTDFRVVLEQASEAPAAQQP